MLVRAWLILRAFALSSCRHTSFAFSSSILHTTPSRTTLLYSRTNPSTIDGPPLSSKPDYSSIHGPFGPLLDRFLTILFRERLASRLGERQHPNEIIIPDSSRPYHDFMGIIEITHAMNTQYTNRTAVQILAQDTLISLFPSFILDRYPSWFAKPFPEFSSKMCAYATMAFGTWLMGECEVNDIPSGEKMGVLVKRCRFLGESQCASICVNSCKIPTQNFFRENMGLGLTMTPDYATGECQFAFGVLPTEEEEREARNTPCLSRCPSGGGLRSFHNAAPEREEWLEDLNKLALAQGASCVLMDD
ncbi:hypothetical protein ACHAWO_000471 [Cyclotella atomus]|uniref:Beta-carotene isomerase D27-like C-terminal domain-containing protein n=1 Tax=Cyclotella atomus TaxID=382360 RepID=A0ABD3NGR5_9STRA